MFVGRYDHALDDKGRTMMPKRFRDRLVALGDSLVWMTPAIDAPRHLDVMPDSIFSAFQSEVSAHKTDPLLITFKRAYFGQALPVEVDSAGRVLIPAQLRQRFQLGDRVSFVGVDERKFELWDPQALDTECDAVAVHAPAIIARLAELGL